VKIEMSFNYIVEISDFKLDSLVSSFRQLLLPLLSSFISNILHQLGDTLVENLPVHLTNNKNDTFCCPKCGSRSFKWKTRRSTSLSTKLSTELGTVAIPKMQIQCRKCGHKRYIVRELLGLLPYARMSFQTEQKLALCGSLTSFRVGEVFSRVFGVSFARSTIWRCVQKVGEKLSFSISPDERGEAQADGTGIPINRIAKRGKELKVLIQKNTPDTARRTGSRWRLAGLDIGNYNGSWKKLFQPSLDIIRSFKSFFLLTDGDDGILKGLKNVRVLLQRCLWHIPHQLKHCLWEDKVTHKSELWHTIMSKIYQIVAIRSYLQDDEIESFIKEKNKYLDNLVAYCHEHDCQKSVSYLKNAKPDMFTALQNHLRGKATSEVERVMRTVNLRINYGKWSQSGALNAMKIRLAFYYNGYNPSKNRRTDN